MQKEIRSIYDTLYNDFEGTDFGEMKLRKALIFEANERLVKHPYDLIGIRRQKLFEDSLNDCLKDENIDTGVTKTENIKCWLHHWLNPLGEPNQVLITLKIVASIIVVTLAITVNDYIQDTKVIKLLWNSANILGENYLKLRFKNWMSGVEPSAIFLTVVLAYSLIQTILNLPTLWYRFKVAHQMASPRVELEHKTIEPAHVLNQFNIPISESRGESIWQLMVQWGVYFWLAWYITWLSQISENEAELENIRSILTFSKMYPSMISSICSLTYGQYLPHAICYKYCTSRKQQLAYLLCCLLSTLCMICVILGLQVAVMDFEIVLGVGRYLSSVSLLMTFALYKYMVLPTSNSKLAAVSITSPSFLHGLTMQCFVFGFYTGLTAVIDFYLYISHHMEWRRTLPNLAFKISGDEKYQGNSFFYLHFLFYCPAGMNPDDLTPATAYQGSPVNNRLFGIIFSCIAIPLTWSCAYTGLYLYFKYIPRHIQWDKEKMVL